MEARRIIISGRVQGVGFRYHMINAAHQLGVAGWVRNRSDGSVEAVVEGSGAQIAAIIHWSRQGPSAARVERVFVEQRETVPHKDFQQLPAE